jgi:predicted nuclease of predicted toxin-antitoxin system
MRLLLDACVPRALGQHFSEHYVRTAHEMGWGDLDNGHLLDAMAEEFDVLVTVDRGLPKQQNLAARPLSVLVLRARSNRLADLLPLVSEALAAMSALGIGQVVVVG